MLQSEHLISSTHILARPLQSLADLTTPQLFRLVRTNQRANLRGLLTRILCINCLDHLEQNCGPDFADADLISWIGFPRTDARLELPLRDFYLFLERHPS